MINRKVTIYVKSVKTAVRTEKIGHQKLIGGPGARGGYRVIPTYEVNSITKYEFVVPEDQNKIVEMVKEIATKHGFDVETVDITRESVLHRALQQEIKKIKIFPTLITDSGEKIEGKISKEQIKSLLSKAN